MAETDTLFPARPLFTLVAKGMAHEGLTHDGPMGRRSAMRALGGAFDGERLRGRIAPGMASAWALESPLTPGLAYLDGLMALQTPEGRPILMKFIGRKAGRYADGSWRIGAGFEADRDSELDWLNDVQAAGWVTVEGDDLRFTLHELLGRASAPDANALPVEPVYRMAAEDSVGERLKIQGQVADRYLSLAESGCRTEGRVRADWPEGCAWGPHRMGKGPMGLPMHIDMRAGLAANGASLIQHYIGVTPRSLLDPAPDADRSWRTAAVFEAPAQGPLAWLNEIVALGFGWIEADEANYEYYAML